MEVYAESGYSLFPSKKGTLKMINNKLYYCAEIKVEYLIAYTSLWRPITKSHLTEILKIKINKGE
jgi:hypothetical protein